jgi:hypothetical protein
MLPCRKTKAYLEMEVKYKLASHKKNPKKDVLVINSKISKKNPSNHDTKRCYMIVNGIHYQIQG